MKHSSSNHSGRLPPLIDPVHYDITYSRIDLVQHVFEGIVSIDCIAAQSIPAADDQAAGTVLVLNACEVVVTKATLKKKKKKDDEAAAAAAEWHAEECRYHVSAQTVEIVFGNESAGCWVAGCPFVVTCHFQGRLNDQMRGFYTSTYTGLDGAAHTMATTQFEPTDARRAFPCLDEPALKATFRLTVTIPANKQCLSNTPVAEIYTSYENTNQLSSNSKSSSNSSDTGGGGIPLKTVTFQRTPKMSTYLLAFVIGEFDCLSETSPTNKIVTTVYTVPGKAEHGQFCLNVAVRALDFYQDLFHTQYPLTKSDLIAIPDFAAGAMENWGCITYREAKILVKPDQISETMRRGIARTTCHELAHQWFGNLVTMEFWTQLWLNEGAARFMEFVAVNHLFPDWNIWTEFVQAVYQQALSLDAMKTSHAVEVVVTHPDEIDEIFDSISYAKGASIIRMVAEYISMDAFFNGISTYLKRHKYGNAVSNDLWYALEEAADNVPVREFMKLWTLEMGYPVLILSDTGDVQVRRFLASGPEDDIATPAWPIPVTALVQDCDEVQGPWVIHGPAGDETAVLQNHIAAWCAADKWFKLNVNQTGFYRVSYTDKQWHRLSTAMNPETGPLSTSDQLGLLADSFATGKAGYASIVDSLALIEHFGEHETAEYVVWQELSENLSALASMYRSEPYYHKIQQFIKKLYQKQFERLGWEAATGEDARVGTLRATVLAMMGMAEDATVLQQAYDRFTAYVSHREKAALPGDLQRTVFRCALRHKEGVVFDELRAIAERPGVLPEEQRNCLAVMGCVQDGSRHTDMMEYVLFSGKVRLQDIGFPLASLSGSTDEGGRAAWRYFQDNFDRLHAALGAGPMWGPCAALCCRGLRTEQEAAAVEAFFLSQSKTGTAKRRLSQVLEVIRTKAQRFERDRELVRAYVTAQ